MKDIENYKLAHVQNALQRLDTALGRLEAASSKTRATAGAPDIAAKLDHLTGAHETLKETAGKVAARLDTAISRLSASLQD